jgi:hypothetical protein
MRIYPKDCLHHSHITQSTDTNLADFISEEQMHIMNEEDVAERLLKTQPNEIFICYKQLDNDFLKMLIKFGKTI